MKFLLINAVSWFADILVFLLLARAVLSWFIRGPYGNVYKIYQMICGITEPIVAPCRKLSEKLNTGMLDLSVFFAFFLVAIVRKLLIMLLAMIL